MESQQVPGKKKELTASVKGSSQKIEKL